MPEFDPKKHSIKNNFEDFLKVAGFDRETTKPAIIQQVENVFYAGFSCCMDNSTHLANIKPQNLVAQVNYWLNEITEKGIKDMNQDPLSN